MTDTTIQIKGPMSQAEVITLVLFLRSLNERSNTHWDICVSRSDGIVAEGEAILRSAGFDDVTVLRK